jgi:DUF1680 family protein
VKLTLPDGLAVALEQQTDYPANGHVSIKVSPAQPAKFPLRIRIPRWCPRACLRLTSTGETIETRGGQFLEINRHWSGSEELDLELALSPRLVKGRKAQSRRVALMYGPTVFCLDPAHQPNIESKDLRLLQLDTNSITGPTVDNQLHPGAITFKTRAWSPNNYSFMTPDGNLTFTEFPDPAGQAAYLLPQNPNCPNRCDDELCVTSDSDLPIL